MLHRVSVLTSCVAVAVIVVACGDEETTGKTTTSHGDASVDGGADADGGSEDAANDSSADGASDASDAAETEAASDAAVITLYEVHLVQQLPGMPFSAPLGMNESGQVVGYAGDEAWSPFSEPVRVDPPAMLVKLSTPAPNYGFARDIVNDGTVVVGEYEFRGAVWTSGTLSQLASVAGYFSTSAWGVTDAGVIVGTFADHDDALPPNPVGPRPCYWPSATSDPVLLGTLDGEANGAAYAVNDSNVIAGVSASAQGFVATRWASPTSPAENLGHVTGAVLSEARGISSNGIIAGRSGFANGTGRAFWRPVNATQLVALPNLPNPAIEYAVKVGT